MSKHVKPLVKYTYIYLHAKIYSVMWYELKICKQARARTHTHTHTHTHNFDMSNLELED